MTDLAAAAGGVIENRLTDEEFELRERCETVITAGIGSYVEVGTALREIRDGELFRDRFVSFGEYVERMWGLSQSRGYQYIDAALVASEVSTIVESAPDDSPLRSTPIPANEGQARELVPFKGQPEVAAEVLRAAEEAGPVTAAKIREAVKKLSASDGPTTPDVAPPAEEPDPEQVMDARQRKAADDAHQLADRLSRYELVHERTIRLMEARCRRWRETQ